MVVDGTDFLKYLVIKKKYTLDPFLLLYRLLFKLNHLAEVNLTLHLNLPLDRELQKESRGYNLNGFPFAFMIPLLWKLSVRAP